MKRSEIDDLIDKAKHLCAGHHIYLPPFAHWTEADWRSKGAECDEIRACRLGWDVTDFGSGAFGEIGLVVLTIRNGHHEIEAYKPTVYCEKLLVVGEGQITPMHCHARKQEDIVCRAGGNLICKVYNRANDGGLATSKVALSLDGVACTVAAGHQFRLEPGQSIRLTPFIYHEFHAERGHEPAIVGEVSTVNDDVGDNIFLGGLPRFPVIEEDTPRRHLLCTEYS